MFVGQQADQTTRPTNPPSTPGFAILPAAVLMELAIRMAEVARQHGHVPAHA